MENLFHRDTNQNTVVHIVLRGSDNAEYECAGVLVREEEDMLRIGFNAKDDIVMDYLDIKKSDILSMNTIPSRDIQHIG